MASLREAGEQLTSQLEDLVDQLKQELTGGGVDFEKLGSLADQISESADGLAETFSNVNETLMKRIQDVQGGEEQSGDRGEKVASQRAAGGGEGKKGKGSESE